MSTTLDPPQVIMGASSLSSAAAPNQGVTSAVECPVIRELVMVIDEPRVESKTPGNLRVEWFRMMNVPAFTWKPSCRYASRDLGSVVMIEWSSVSDRPAETVRE